MEFIAMLAMAVPGTVLGVGFIRGFNSGIFHSGFMQGLYGTGAILVIVFIVRSLPIGTRSGIAALRQIDKSIEEIENVLRDTLDLESVLILHGYRSLKVSMKIAGRRNEFTIKPISDGRVSVEHDVMSLTTSDYHEFDSAKELAEKLHDLQILEKKAKDLFFSGTVFTSAYDS